MYMDNIYIMCIFMYIYRVFILQSHTLYNSGQKYKITQK